MHNAMTSVIVQNLKKQFKDPWGSWAGKDHGSLTFVHETTLCLCINLLRFCLGRYAV